jgi:pyrimidine-nucleoside phosphorylase
MSKKLAMGASALILDVKSGSGAFMRKYQDSKALAQSLIAAAAGSGTKVEALITDMDRPLGVAAGNANEIVETIEVLKGKGPQDVLEVTRAQAERLLVMSGKFDESSAKAKLDETLRNGAALEQARRWLSAQGADAAVVDDYSKLPRPRTVVEVKAPRSGYITHIDTYAAGMFTVDLGAGRKKADDVIDYAAGVMFDRRSGDAVRSGDVIARIELGRKQPDPGELRTRFLSFVQFGDAPPEARTLIHERLT